MERGFYQPGEANIHPLRRTTMLRGNPLETKIQSSVVERRES
jgi:hypothetical protein